MKAYVICCNDSLIVAVLDNEELAQQKLNEYEKTNYEYGSKHEYTYEDYKRTYFWHIHTIDCVEK